MKPLPHQLFDAIRTGDVERVEYFLWKHPQLFEYDARVEGSRLHDAAGYGQIAVAELLLRHNHDVNAERLPERWTPLTSAVTKKQYDMAKLLLGKSANPNIGRILVHAQHNDDQNISLKMVRLLVEHGADVNQVFLWYDDPDIPFTALDWAEDNGLTVVAEYLRSKGAKRAAEFSSRLSKPAKSPADEVVDYFTKTVGQPKPGALIEIVPTEPTIAVRMIPPAKGRNHITLFTTGMSELPMTIPTGETDYRYAELFIELPAGWPLTRAKLGSMTHGWPVHWLRTVAKYPHQHRTWLGGPATVITNEETPQPFAADVPFAGVLLLAEHHFESEGGDTVYLYRMTPLYPEEIALEKSKGLPALLKAFDKAGITFIVDPTRPCVAPHPRT